MKRIFSLLFAAMFAGQAWAQTTFTVGNLEYTVTDETNHYVSVGKAETEPTGALNIPEKVTNPDNSAEYSVTSIGRYAFYNCSGLTTVTIPNSVTSIGNSAFDGCSGLTSVSIPNSVASIGSDAFYNCSGLTSVSIPNSVTSIGSYAFYYCSGLTSVTIPNSVTSIGSGAFYYCSGLTSVTIPNSVTSIGRSAFYGCRGLTSVTIPNSVTSIGSSAFYGCRGLTSITIPNSVTSIGELAFSGSGLTSVTIPNSVTSIEGGAFYDCSSLAEINVESANTNYASENGVLFNKDKTTIVCYPAGKTETTYTIPNSVTSIGGGAFYDCSGLTSVTIPNSVTSIGSYAFSGCSSLTSVTIPNSVTSIEGGAFWDCSGLTSVSIPNSVTSIGDRAFRSCSGLTKVTIPNSVTSIGVEVFRGCSGLTSVTIPNSVTSIGDDAFYGCTNSTIICEAETKPEGWDNGWDSDGGKVVWNVQVSENNDFEFKYDSNQDDKVATLVKYKGNADTVSVPSAVLVDGTIYTVTQIGDEAFNGCASVKSIKLPSSIKSYGKMAFKNCTALKFLFVSQSVANIGEDAFNGCTTVTIACEADSKPEGWNKNWNYNGGKVVWNALLGESKDFEFEYDSTQDGDFIARLVKYKGDSESVSVPTVIITDSAEYTVIYINKEAFCENKRIKTVKLPTTLRGFGDRVFKNCTSLESIVIPDSVDRISESMFSGCSSLKSVEFSPSIEYIMNGAFEKSGLEFVALPKTVTSIYDFAFAECENLKLVYIPETVVKNEYYAFVDCTNATIYCAAAKQPETWKELWNEDGGKVVWGHSVPADSTLELKFATKSDGTAAVTECLSESSSVEVPMMVMVDSSAYFVTSITGQPFFNCRNLSSINVVSENKIFASVDGVLYNKEKTKLIVCPPKKTGTVTIPNTVTSIETMAFTGCEDLQSVEIPNSVTEIGGWAFSGCAGLESISIPNSVTSIGDAAFRRCLGLTEITIPKSVVNMGSDVFAERETPITVYCEVSRKPEGWDDNWDSAYGITPCDVVWADNTPITETAANAVNIYAHGNTIVVENATDEISVYDAMGRIVCRDAARHVSTVAESGIRTEIRINKPGVYIAKTGAAVKRIVMN